jgi:hypothetical protein
MMNWLYTYQKSGFRYQGVEMTSKDEELLSNIKAKSNELAELLDKLGL